MTFTKATMFSVIALGLVTQGCGKDKAGDSTEDKGNTPTSEANATTPAAAATTAPAKKELPPPPKDVYEGKARLVNFGMQDGKPVAVDVWATRSFKYAPLKLAENIAFGAATEWFQSPKGSPVKVFVTGTGPDSKDDLGGMFHPKKGAHISGVLVMKEDGSTSIANWWNTSDDAESQTTPDAPSAGTGLVTIRAGQLHAYEATLKDTIGGWALQVGNGDETGKCAPQRVEEMGFSPSILGGTQPVELGLAPGTHTITFHKRSDRECRPASKVHEVSVEVKADGAQVVMLYTEDTKTLKHLVLDVPVNTAKPYGTNKKIKEAREVERAAKKAAKKAAKEAEAAAK